MIGHARRQSYSSPTCSLRAERADRGRQAWGAPRSGRATSRARPAAVHAGHPHHAADGHASPGTGRDATPATTGEGKRPLKRRLVGRRIKRASRAHDLTK
eukprot:6222555-Pyramimonas_sp.AAC.1